MVQHTKTLSDATISTEQSNKTLLPHESQNETATQTLLLLHGALSSPIEYTQTIKHLADYHLLIPYMPGHGPAAALKPFTLTNTSDLLAHLIRTKAHNGAAHVVGVSLGAHVGLHFASQYPDLVGKLFVSGYNHFEPSALGPALPYFIYGTHVLQNMVPNKLAMYFMDGADMDLRGTGTRNVDLIRNITDVLVYPAAEADARLLPVQADTVVVAATKKGVIPSNDSVSDAKDVVKRIRRSLGGGVKVAVEMKRMRHPWHMQEPEVFADCVKTWISDNKLQDEMTRL